MKTNKLFLAAITLIAFLQSSLMAGVITPVSASASSYLDSRYVPANLINGSGQSGPNDLTQTANADFGGEGFAWIAQGDGSAGNVSDQWVAFDLGANFTLSSADIWQYNENYDLTRGVADFALYTSPTADVNDATNFVGNFSLAISPANSSEPVQGFPISVSNVRLVKFAIIDDQAGNSNNLPNYVGLSEVRFEGSIPQAAITLQPANTTNLLSESHTFSVTASGPAPLSYQWYRSPSTAISGATNSSYSVGLVTGASAGGYYVIVTNSSSSVTSSVANMTVVSENSITPVAATASSYLDSRYVPSHLIDGSGQSGPNEIFNQRAAADFGGDGFAWISDGTANVSDTWVAFDLGANVTLSSADIWQYNENFDLNRGVADFALYTSPTADVNDATNFVGNFSLAISPPNSGEPVQRFPISVSNVRLVKFAIIDDFNGGAILDYDGLSEVKFEGNIPQATITFQPANTTNLLNESHTFSVTAVGGTPPLSYQWYRSPGTAISGATNSSYSIGSVTGASAGGYYVLATDANSISITSSVANMTVVSEYSITPVAATASSYLDSRYVPANLINGSGQPGPNEIFNQRAAADFGGEGFAWVSDGTANVSNTWVAFDLGANVTLSSADIWQYNENYDLNRGVEDFAIYTSPTADVNDATNFVGTFSLAISPPNSGEPVQRFPISVSNVRLVKFAIIDDFNNTVNLIDPDYDGLSEVKFEGPPLPPLITTFGVTGGTVSLSAQHGTANGPWTLLQSTNVATPLGQWQEIASGSFDALGKFSTNLVNTANGTKSFFILKVQ